MTYTIQIQKDKIKKIIAILLLIGVVSLSFFTGLSFRSIINTKTNSQMIIVAPLGATHFACYVNGQYNYRDLAVLIKTYSTNGGSFLTEMPNNVTFQVTNDDVMPVYIQIWFYQFVSSTPTQNSNMTNLLWVVGQGVFKTISELPVTPFEFQNGKVTLTIEEGSN